MNKLLSSTAQLALVVALLVASTAARAEPVKVRHVSFPITLSDNHTYSVAGHLYTQGHHKPRTLQVLVHGATYNHRYWDAPEINGHAYSYARHMAKEGYAVLAIDQLGAGESDSPDGDFFTLPEAASAVHQVMSGLRTKHNPLHRAFHKIVLVGHSLGSITAAYAEGTYGDADGLVITGTAFTPHPPPIDPQILVGLFQAPYVTWPGTLRTELFYFGPTADQDVVDHDNAHLNDQVGRGLFFSAFGALNDPSQLPLDLITEPVLVQLGEDDLTSPGSLAPSEAAHYPMAESVTVETLPDIGHAFNLHVNNEEGWEQIDEWIGAHVDDHDCDD